MKAILTTSFLLWFLSLHSQNVGIGTTAPGFPLNFSNALGNKISLYGNSGNHYGFGIQGGLLQMYSDAAAADIAFGYGSSSSFTEVMRIKGTGNVGIGTSTPTSSLMIATNVNPQLHIRQTSAADYSRIRMQTGTNRYWDIAGYNDGTTISNERLNFFNSQAGDILSITGSGYVGIGNNNPNSPLAFAPSLGKKITLYPGASGDVGFGVVGNRLQIYSDNPNADVAIGYDAAGVFNERFAFKPNGALAINGNTGSSGQLIASNGNSPAEWKNIGALLSTYNSYHSASLNSPAVVPLNNATINFSVNQPSKILIWYNVETYSPCLLTCYTNWGIRTQIDGIQQQLTELSILSVSQSDFPKDCKTVGPEIYTVAAGSHSLTFTAQLLFGVSTAVALRPCALIFAN